LIGNQIGQQNGRRGQGSGLIGMQERIAAVAARSKPV